MATTIETGSGVSTDLMAAVNSKKKVATDTVQADTDKFLTLLVTQLKNQDPMNPLDNAQLTSQLAQMSTVTGVNKLNTTLESLKSSYQSSESLQAVGMIGKSVLSAGNKLELTSKGAVLGVELGTSADKAQVLIHDSAGKLIKTIDLGSQAAGVVPLTWDGSTMINEVPGQAAITGKYTFTVEATRGDTKLKDAKALAYGVVASVSTGADGIKINVPTAGMLNVSDIKQVM